MKYRPTKILFVNHSANMAGAERVLLELIIGLKEFNVQSKVILPYSGIFDKYLKKNNIDYEIIPYTWWAGKKEKQNKYKKDSELNINAVFEMAKIIRKFKPELVYSNTMTIPWGAFASAVTHTKHVWGIHEFGDTDHNLKFYSGYESSFTLIGTLSDAVITNSKAVERNAAKYIDRNKISQYYYFINIPELSRQRKMTYFKSVNKLKLLNLGTITPFKGQLDTVKAFSQTKSDKAELTFVGPVEDNAYLKKILTYIERHKLQNRVKVFGYTDNPYKAIKQADVVILASKNEAIGRIVFESMLLKKPVIGTNTGGTPEQITNGFNGFLYKPGDIRQLSKYMDFFQKHREKVQEFGANGYKFVTTTFTRDKYFLGIYHLFLDILGQKRKYETEYFEKIIQSKLSEINTSGDLLGDIINEHSLLIRNEIQLNKFKKKNEILDLQISEIKNKTAYLERDLMRLKSSKFFKAWQRYCEIRNLLFLKHDR